MKRLLLSALMLLSAAPALACAITLSNDTANPVLIVDKNDLHEALLLQPGQTGKFGGHGHLNFCALNSGNNINFHRACHVSQHSCSITPIVHNVSDVLNGNLEPELFNPVEA